MKRETARKGRIHDVFHVSICIPTLNAGALWHDWLQQAAPAIARTTTLVVDSSSDDDTATLAARAGCRVEVIERAQFDHGATRDWALRQLDDYEIVIFLTQDALLASPTAIEELVAVFEDPTVGAAYGRQLPHRDATPFATHARLFNYPAHSHRVAPEDMARWGIKAAFLSNSFAAYRRQALLDAGGFPHGAILSEDMVAGARLLQAGWHLAYCAQACVQHSHNYSWGQEFRRYFDIGVLHARERWILEMTGNAEREGQRFVVSELRYLARHAPWAIPGAFIRNALKYLGYRLGRHERSLPLRLKRRLSMNRGYWAVER